MTGAMKAYVRIVDRMNRWIGRIVMYGIFVMMAILLWSTFTKVGSDLGFGINPSLWTLEMAQFAMVAYYMLGGPYSIQMGSNVRMDLLYGTWSDSRKAQVDAMSVLFLIVYLAFLLWGGWDSLMYSFQYGGERSSSAWRPYLWPVKTIMVIGIFLMLLQAISELFKDILRTMGHDMGAKDIDLTNTAPGEDAA
ncbi:TRAP transporter small permease subunit [Silicimonas sp. MF1-12-2]|uniref:TRAP transporter small permease subunit n=1 Tax=Silicimonas sp. MF1-12-2 TaxID=3384793 RepID=UPI0039B52D8A